MGSNVVDCAPLLEELLTQNNALLADLRVAYAEELKQMVDSGQATATQTTFDGIPAYELRLHASGDKFLNGTAYVTQSDYRPLEIDSTASRGEKIVFSAYDHMPAMPANDALPAVTTAHPGATVVNEAGKS